MKRRRPVFFNNILLILFLIGCAPIAGVFADGMKNNNTSIIGTWRWIKTITPVEKITPLTGKEYLVSFNPDGTVSMKLEINRINGTYQTEDKRLTINSPMIMTLAAWLPESPAPSFMNLMEHAAGYFFVDEELYIDTFADGGTSRFEPVS